MRLEPRALPGDRWTALDSGGAGPNPVTCSSREVVARVDPGWHGDKAATRPRTLRPQLPEPGGMTMVAWPRAQQRTPGPTQGSPCGGTARLRPGYLENSGPCGTPPHVPTTRMPKGVLSQNHLPGKWGSTGTPSRPLLGLMGLWSQSQASRTRATCSSHTCPLGRHGREEADPVPWVSPACCGSGCGVDTQHR